MVTVSNIAHNPAIKRVKGYIYIGRPSIFGNPFTMPKDGSRPEVIAKYERYFIRRMSSTLDADRPFQEAVNAIPPDAVLGCFCAPLPCHGSVIAKYVNGRNAHVVY